MLLLLGENAAIAIAGFVAALSISAVTLQVAWRLIPTTIPIPGSAAQITLAQPTLDLAVVLLACALFAVGLVVFSFPIMWKGSRAIERGGLHVNARNQSPTRRTLRVHHALVTTELALATLLLIGAGLAVRTTASLLRVDPGLQPEGLLSMYVGNLNDRSQLERVRFFDGIVREIAALPGVRAVGLNDYVPLQNEDDFEGVRFPDRPAPLPGQGPREEWRRVSAEYFEAAGITLLSGRAFTTQDDHQHPSVAVVNRAFVDKYYTSDPVGERIFLTNQEYGLTEIVGVVDNVLRRGLDQASPPVVYVPYARRPRPNMAVFVRAEGDLGGVVTAVQQAIWRVDPEQPIDRINVVTDVVNASIGIPRLVMRVVGGLAGLAAVLSAIGVCGVTAYAVRLRRHEIGIRVALGATPSRIRSQIVRRGVMIAGGGLLLGGTAAALLGGGVRSLLFGVTPTDPVTFGAVGALLLLVAVAASYVPAHRASRLDPVESIRAE
jgi:predicted permease